MTEPSPIGIPTNPPITLFYPADFYVSPNGNDAWDGQSPSYASGQTGPFATLARARQAVLALKQQDPSRSSPIVVLFRGGNYYLQDTVNFGPDDSGTASAPIVYKAYPGETPVLSGGTPLTNWSQVSPGRWQATLPTPPPGQWQSELANVGAAKWYFSQLFVGNQRRFRPRLPKTGYFKVAKVATTADFPSCDTQGAGTRCDDRYFYDPTQAPLSASWHNLNDVELVTFGTWYTARNTLAAIDETTHSVQASGQYIQYPAWPANYQAGSRFFVDNVEEALTDPGQWYLDKNSGVVTYLPYGNEDLNSLLVVAPRLRHLLKFNGDVASRSWVSYLTFDGITFSHSNWYVDPKIGQNNLQAQPSHLAALQGRGMRNITFAHCVFEHLSESAIDFGIGSQNNVVSHSMILDTGAGGIKIGTYFLNDYATEYLTYIGRPGGADPEAFSSGNLIEDNFIGYNNRITADVPGILIGTAPGNTIRQNTIRDFYFTPIHIGFSWYEGNQYNQNQTVEYNLIQNIGQGVVDDFGGIYFAGGDSSGSVVNNNVITNVQGALSGNNWAHGIYMDAYTSNVTITNNTVDQIGGGCYAQNYGYDNVVENNIFAHCGFSGILRSVSRPGGDLPSVMTVNHNVIDSLNNSFYGVQGAKAQVISADCLSGDCRNSYTFDNNVYWSDVGSQIYFSETQSFATWQGEMQDRSSVIADPLFTTTSSGLLTLSPSSPAYGNNRFGFRLNPIDTSKVGARDLPKLVVPQPYSAEFSPD